MGNADVYNVWLNEWIPLCILIFKYGGVMRQILDRKLSGQGLITSVMLVFVQLSSRHDFSPHQPCVRVPVSQLWNAGEMEAEGTSWLVRASWVMLVDEHLSMNSGICILSSASSTRWTLFRNVPSSSNKWGSDIKIAQRAYSSLLQRWYPECGSHPALALDCLVYFRERCWSS